MVRRVDPDSRRFRDIVRGKIRDNLKHYISRGELIARQGKNSVSVPLPHGKRLFLGPGKSGEIGSKADEHPPLVALIEAGQIEVLGTGSSQKGGSRKGGGSVGGGQSHTPDKGVFRSGDG